MALRGDIRLRVQHTVAAHERRHAPVAAPAHGVLGDTVPGRERAHLEVGLIAPRVQAEHVDARDSDRAQGREPAHVGGEGSDRVAAGELEREPDGTDVDDRRAPDVGGRDAECLGRRSDLRPARLAELGRGQCQEQPLVVDPDVDEPLAALLHQPAGRPRLETVAQRGVGRSDRRMSGERKLPPGREDTQAVVGARVRRGADERRLGQVGPGGDRLHRGARHRVAVEHDRDGVALERHRGEHVHLLEGESAHCGSSSNALRRWQATRLEATTTVTDHRMYDQNSLPSRRRRATMTAVEMRTVDKARHARSARAYRYEETARFITELVDSGTLIPGARVPSLREITRQRRVSLSTALQAYRTLEDRGVLQARPQSGFYVAKGAPILLGTPAISKPPGRPTTVAVSGVVPKFLEYAGDPNLLPLGCAIPDAELLAAGRLDRFLARAARAKGVDYNKYTVPKGDPRLRREIARRALRWGQVLSPEDIVITCGCTEALVLALKVLSRPGDAIAIESPTYFGFLQVLEALDLRALELPTDARSGVDLT